MENKANGGFYLSGIPKLGVYFVFYAEFLLGIVMCRHNQYNVVAPVFLAGAFFNRFIFNPVAMGIASKQDYHFHLFITGW